MIPISCYLLKTVTGGYTQAKLALNITDMDKSSSNGWYFQITAFNTTSESITVSNASASFLIINKV